MDLNARIESFSIVGEIITNALEGKSGFFEDRLNSLIENQVTKNPWFTPPNVRLALQSVAGMLKNKKLNTWAAAYPELAVEKEPVVVGVIMAGNIPLVGFHDFLCVLMSGNRFIGRTSSKDPDLIRCLADLLCSQREEFRNMIEFTDGLLKGFDAVIATGSDNSARYFDYYFGKYPGIIRKNRNSVAVIEGDETDEELRNVGRDVFSYFGLGCRNVSKIFLPEGYKIDRLLGNWDIYSDIILHSKYANNYEYNMAVYLVNKEPFLDSGYLLLKENSAFSSPVAVLYYEFYSSSDDAYKLLSENENKIQCVTGRKGIPFGKAQMPELWDYADNIDTMDFLLKKKYAGIL